MYNQHMMQQMQPTNNNPNYQMDFQNQNDANNANMDMAMKMKKRQAMANMLQKQMESPSAPTTMGGLSGVVGGLAMGMNEKQQAQDFQTLMKNGAFGGAGAGLAKYL